MSYAWGINSFQITGFSVIDQAERTSGKIDFKLRGNK
jgi:hypothetical protein